MLAALVQHLAAGARLATGAPNASGLAWFYQPGTTSTAVVYLDANAEVQATQPVTLSAAGKAEVYVAGPVRMVVQSVVSTGVYATVDDLDVLTGSAPSVGVRNDGFTGTDPDDGTQVAGGDTTLDAVLSSLATSFGGVDGKYKEFTGATARTFQSVIRGIHVSVKDFNAVGNGIADDTSAIQAAINEVARLGGGIVYFDPGTYLISTALTLSSKNGVSFMGAGSTVSIVKQSGAAANALTLASCSGFFIEDIAFSHSTSSSGIGISVADCDRVRLQRVLVSAVFAAGVQFSGTTTITSIDDCEILTVQGSAAARGVRYNGSGLYHWITDSIIGGGDTNASHIEFASTAGTAHVHRCHFPVLGTSKAINVSGTGTRFNVIGCPSLGSTATPFVFTGAQRVVQIGNGIDGYTEDVASGGTMQPDQQHGDDITIRGTTTGVAYVISAPAITPTARGQKLILRFYNNAGGAVTGWTLNAIYHTTGVINTADGNTTAVTFLWNLERSIWQENCRAVTA